MISQTVRTQIETRLAAIEREEKVCIFYACESGSRAWGFASENSDYDARFLYIHPRNWYLTIEERRDVIERPILDDIDLNGWDIRKALSLLRKSNPPLLEWLQSPITYKQQLSIVEKIRALMPEYYSPLRCMHHYLHMAEGNFREYLKKDEVWVKKYFYVLRPVLACKWIEAGYGVVPTEFQKLVDRLVDSPSLKSAIDELIERKRNGQELDMGPKIPIISEFIESELSHFATLPPYPKSKSFEVQRLDKLFQDSLVEFEQTQRKDS